MEKQSVADSAAAAMRFSEFIKSPLWNEPFCGVLISENNASALLATLIYLLYREEK